MAATITYAEAVGTLKAMFSDFDEDILIAVLESNGRHMERSIEQLLTMEADVSRSTGPTAPASESSVPSPKPPSAASSATRSSSSRGPEPPSRAPSEPPAATSGRTTHAPSSHGHSHARPRWRNPLPDDFLQVPGVDLEPTLGSPGASPSSAVHASSSTSSSQLLQDEILAQMFQDQEFINELQSDPEFAAYMRSLERQQRRAARGRHHPHARPEPPGLSRLDSRVEPGSASASGGSGGSSGSSGGGWGSWFGLGSSSRSAAPAPAPAPHVGEIRGADAPPVEAAGSGSGGGWSAFKSGMAQMGTDMRQRFARLAAGFNRRKETRAEVEDGGTELTSLRPVTDGSAQYRALTTTADDEGTALETDDADVTIRLTHGRAGAPAAPGRSSSGGGGGGGGGGGRPSLTSATGGSGSAASAASAAAPAGGAATFSIGEEDDEDDRRGTTTLTRRTPTSSRQKETVDDDPLV